jgi:uncharacterized membrane protein
MSEEQGNNPLKTVIYGIVGFNVFMGVIQGCITFFTEDSFSKGFFDSAGWVIQLSIIVIFILIMSGLFGFFNNKR